MATIGSVALSGVQTEPLWLVEQGLNDRLPGLTAKIMLDETRVSGPYRNFGYRADRQAARYAI